MKTLTKIVASFIIATAVYANDGVVTFKKSYDIVKTVAPAKSKKMTCITRVMINEGLLDNGDCPIDEVYVMNNKNFYIGTLATSIPANSYGTYLDYDEENGRYRGLGRSIKVKYSDTEPMDADVGLESYVQCPNGMKPYIDGNVFKCKAQYSCENGEYAYDEYTCYDLPENAHRNVKTGYKCNQGYIEVSTGNCEEKVHCSSDEIYDADNNTCITKPENSHWAKNGWECNNGYIKVNNISCEEKVQCTKDERYHEFTNSCMSKPENSHWDSNNNFSWECDGGYIQIFNHCEKEANCEKLNTSNNTCYTKPENSHWTAPGKYVHYWNCDDGYIEIYGSCVKKTECSNEERYYKTANICLQKPKYSHWNSDYSIDTWSCDEGYRLSNDGERCIPPSIAERFNKVADAGIEFDFETDVGIQTSMKTGFVFDLTLGTEFYIANKSHSILISVLPSVTWQIKNIENEHVEYTTNTGFANIGLRMAFGNPGIKFYLMPSISYVFASTVSYDETSPDYSSVYGFSNPYYEIDNFNVENVVYGIEVGFMLNDYEQTPFDIFAKVQTNPYNYKFIERYANSKKNNPTDCIITAGFRVGF